MSNFWNRLKKGVSTELSTPSEKNFSKEKQLYQENQTIAKKLESPWQEYFFACQAYLYTEAGPQLLIEQELQKLLHRLSEGQVQNLLPKYMFHADASSYGRQILQHCQIPRIHDTPTLYRDYLILFLVTVFSIDSIYLFTMGWLNYSSFTAGLNMPVAISLLGLILELLLVIILVFFVFQFTRQSYYGLHWYKRFNWCYLLLIGLLLFLIAIVPYFSLYYSIFIIRFPVWIVWAMLLTGLLPHRILPYLGIDTHLERWLTQVSSPNKLSLREENSTYAKNPLFSHQKTSLRQTILLHMPLINRKNYRKTAKKEKTSQQIVQKKEKH